MLSLRDLVGCEYNRSGLWRGAPSLTWFIWGLPDDLGRISFLGRLALKKGPDTVWPS